MLLRAARASGEGRSDKRWRVFFYGGRGAPLVSYANLAEIHPPGSSVPVAKNQKPGAFATGRPTTALASPDVGHVPWFLGSTTRRRALDSRKLPNLRRRTQR